MMKQRGKIIIAPNINVWPHEVNTARALAAAGMIVEFIPRSEEAHRTSADVLINGMEWEMKSPKSGKVSSIEKNVRKALHQSNRIIFDSQRIKNLPDSLIERELLKNACSLRSVKHLIFVNRQRRVIDIK